MATKADFSNEEWTKLTEAPLLAGMGISLLDMGVVSFAKELHAMIKAVVSAKESYAGNALVHAIIADFESKSTDTPPAAPEKKTSDGILADLGHVVAIVDAKAGADEARGFKTFLFGISEQVAGASGSGFLGFGEKISDDEKAYLAKLKSTLSV
ncbi:hypothetical protein AKJ09_04880 [Labilithrix luteola]|uniref:Uncharacterized protein n=1 Tax=Labilithrix luteola TaxID=1391654 RepID=A0A0K1PXX4_9BACT|nr:hypothetical protein [Labilithrix luteola]AKU98216.1 hypothetical protein AKJ09_04880 [Labilithrix luteola]